MRRRVHREARSEIVTTVEHKIAACDQPRRVAVIQTLSDGLDHDVLVQRRERLRRALDLGAANVRAAVDDLALQVGEAGRIRIDDPQPADPCGG